MIGRAGYVRIAEDGISKIEDDVSIRDTTLGRAGSLLFAVVFLTAVQGQAVGLRHCSLHDALPGSAGSERALVEPGGHDSPVSGPSAHEPGHHAQEGEHSGAPGGCMDDCHIGSTTVAEGGAARISTSALHPSSGPVTKSGLLKGHRHASYALHLPNAPPSFA